VFDDHEYEKSLAGRRDVREGVVLENGARYEGEWQEGSDIR
jgi:hypothetical protein